MTKGQLEAKITEAMMKFQREQMGRGPIHGKTYIIEDVVLVRLQGVLIPAERELAKTPEGSRLVKEMRTQLLETQFPLLCQMVEDITDARVVRLHTDINVEAEERIEVFILDVDLDARFGYNKSTTE